MNEEHNFDINMETEAARIPCSESIDVNISECVRLCESEQASTCSSSILNGDQCVPVPININEPTENSNLKHDMSEGIPFSAVETAILSNGTTSLCDTTETSLEQMEDPVTSNISTYTPSLCHDSTESMQVSEPVEAPITTDLFLNKTLLELSLATWKNGTSCEKNQPYLRGCLWSPDGTCCLSVVNMDGMHLIDLPRDLYQGSVECNRKVDALTTAVHVKEAGLIYDFCWYPGMNSAIPETCCWLSSRQHGPLQLWDAFDGGLRCSYRGFDHVDELEPAVACAFSQDGQRIYAGYKKCIRTFDTNRPGRDYSSHPTKSPCSSIGQSRSLLAVGSWDRTIGLYSVRGDSLKCVGRMHGHSGGVTLAKFTNDGARLVTGARKDDKLCVWDLRFYRRPLNILPRRVATNQRVYFDISPCGRYLVSGGTDGMLRVWDSLLCDWSNARADVSDDTPTFQFKLHEDCCNSISINPHRPIIATGSGQYHARDPIASLGDVDIPDDVIADQSDVAVTAEAAVENSLVFWWVGNVPDLAD